MQHEQDHENDMFYTLSVHVGLIQATMHWEYKNILCSTYHLYLNGNQENIRTLKKKKKRQNLESNTTKFYKVRIFSSSLEIWLQIMKQ